MPRHSEDPIFDSFSFSDQLRRISLAFRERGVFSSFMVIEQASYSEGLITGMQVLQGAFFRPNILFLSVLDGSEREEAYRLVVQHATSLGLGALVYAPHPESRLGQRQYINVWIRDRSPDWQLRWDFGNLDLAILSAYKLMRNWRAEMRLITVIQAEADRAGATRFMSRLVDLARIPDTQVVVAIGDFCDYVKSRRWPTSPSLDLCQAPTSHLCAEWSMLPIRPACLFAIPVQKTSWPEKGYSIRMRSGAWTKSTSLSEGWFVNTSEPR